ncbi:MAG: TIGR00341 family protein [Promethearchaeota archaeon]|jgi:uncharacterized hydrophobic protein (TIGR00271 family)
MRQVQIILENKQKELIQKVLEVINTDLNIKHMLVLEGDSNSLIIVSQKNVYVPELIKKLEEIGVGTEFGIINILPLEARIPELPKRIYEDTDELTARITQEEIRLKVENRSKPSFNYFLFIILSAIIAGAGLILNSPAVVIASMVISPLMGPILGLSFGIVTSDRKMIRNSTIAQAVGSLISIGSGILLGGIRNLFVENPQITMEMSTRYFPNAFDLMIAICASIAVGFSVSGSVKSTLIGMAIALSLMPPAVNVGLALMYGSLSLSFGSLILLLTNIIIINICTMIVLKIKKID